MDNKNMKYIMTDNLEIIDYGDGGGKLQIYNKYKSPYGWSPRKLIVSHMGKPLKDITYNYIKQEVDKCYELFDYSEIDELLTKLKQSD
tara:strand:- start:546 stop:809 length:264 start_codon:yes stop_codon:yes gene_type:complete